MDLRLELRRSKLVVASPKRGTWFPCFPFHFPALPCRALDSSVPFGTGLRKRFVVGRCRTEMRPRVIKRCGWIQANGAPGLFRPSRISPSVPNLPATFPPKNVAGSSANFVAACENFPLTVNLLTTIVKRRSLTDGAEQPCGCLCPSLLVLCFLGPYVNRKFSEDALQVSALGYAPKAVAAESFDYFAAGVNPRSGSCESGPKTKF